MSATIVRKQKIDYEIPHKILEKMSHSVGDNYENLEELINSVYERTTPKSKFALIVNSADNNAFAHLIECYPFKDDLRIARVEIQRVGCSTNEVTEYDAVPSQSMRMLVVIGQQPRMRTNITWYFQGHPIPYLLTSNRLFATSPNGSRFMVSSGNIFKRDNVTLKVSKGFVVSILVDVLRDAPRIYMASRISDEFIGTDEKQEEFCDKAGKFMEQGKLDPEKFLSGMKSLATAGQPAAATVDDEPEIEQMLSATKPMTRAMASALKTKTEKELAEKQRKAKEQKQ